MDKKDINKILALLFDIKKRVNKIEKNNEAKNMLKCRPGRSERSEEPLHGEGPSG